MLHQYIAVTGVLLALGLSLLSLLFAAILAAVRSDIGNAAAGDFGAPVLTGLEAGLLALLGALLARATVAFAIALLGGGVHATEVTAWVFLLWAGPVDLLHHAFTGTWWLTPDRVMNIATIVGGLTGGLGGAWRIHDWRGGGWIGFPLDVTWGLPGNVHGILLHLINSIFSTQHAWEPRHEAHRYVGGFGLQSGFLFTQGCVISNSAVDDTYSSEIFAHERTHVWQNRAFGPLYTFSYIAWMLIFLVPALIAGLINGAGPFTAARVWCYFNNPWEVWGYAAGNDDRTGHFTAAGAEAQLLWRPLAIILAAIPVYVATAGVAFLVVRGI